VGLFAHDGITAHVNYLRAWVKYRLPGFHIEKSMARNQKQMPKAPWFPAFRYHSLPIGWFYVGAPPPALHARQAITVRVQF
jgi:hypothetical protein